MKYDNLTQALRRYRELIIQESKQNLASLGKKNSGGLYDKIKPGKVIVRPNSLEFSIKMPFYAAFVDQGVKGNDPSRVSPNAKRKKQQAPNSPYRFGSGKYKGTFKSFVSKMTDFAKRKNIRFRNKQGEFVAGGYKSMGYVIASNIYNRGLKPSLFFTKPFQKYFSQQVPQEITDAFGLDVSNFISFMIKQNFKNNE